MGCPSSKSTPDQSEDVIDKIGYDSNHGSSYGTPLETFRDEAHPGIRTAIGSNRGSIVSAAPVQRDEPARTLDSNKIPAGTSERDNIVATPANTPNKSNEPSRVVTPRPEEYISRKQDMIMAGIDVKEIESKLEEIRAMMEGHNNENASDAEKKWFIEKLCWEDLIKDQYFPGRRPRNAFIDAHKKRPSTEIICHGCVEQGLRTSCPWIRTESCPVFSHKKYRIRLGDEVFQRCPQCAAEQRREIASV